MLGGGGGGHSVHLHRKGRKVGAIRARLSKSLSWLGEQSESWDGCDKCGITITTIDAL